MASIPAKWFTQYVREELIVELSKLMGTAEQPIPIEKWPNAEAIIVNTLHSNKAARVLRLFLKRYQERAFFFSSSSSFPLFLSKRCMQSLTTHPWQLKIRPITCLLGSER